MTLPSSGPISFNDIRIELGIPTQAPFSLEDAENGTYVPLQQCASPRPSSANPASINEWYGYNHNATASAVLTNMEGPQSTSELACALEPDDNYTLYEYDDIYYPNNVCTSALNNYYADTVNDMWYQFNSGVLVSSGDCTPTPPPCADNGDPCSIGGDCCSGYCNESNVCAEPPCGESGAPCDDNTDCCEGFVCFDGGCVAV